MKATKDGQLVLTDTPDVQALDLMREARTLLHHAIQLQTHGSALSVAAGVGTDNVMEKLGRLIDAQANLNKREKLLTQHALPSAHTIRLYQTPNKGYIVEYGLQRTVCPTWELASKEFGSCLFHALECEGKVERP